MPTARTPHARAKNKPVKQELNIGRVLTFKMHNIWAVPSFKMHNIWTVPTFKMYNTRTVPISKGWLLKVVIGFLTNRRMVFRYKVKVSSIKSLPGGAPKVPSLDYFFS